MGMMTPLLEARRIIEQRIERLFTNLPQPLIDRLIALRNAYPKTPLQYLPLPVRAEVEQILTSALADSAPSPAPQPPPEATGHEQPILPQPLRERLVGLRQTYPNTPRPAPVNPIAQLSTVIGTETHTGRDISITQKAKQQGMYLIGEDGTGKTSLLKTMITEDIKAGLGLCLIEPHGALTHDILGAIPRHRLGDVVYLDIEDYEFPFGLNLFELPEQSTLKTQAAAASFVSHTFEALWNNSGFDTPRLMQNLRAVTRTLFSNPGSTFAEIPLLYSNADVRARMLARVTNHHILTF